MLRGLQKLQNFRLYHFQDIKVAIVGKVVKFQTIFQDIKVARVAKVAKFQTLSFSRYQSSEDGKDCKVTDFIFFRISRLQWLQIKVGKVGEFQTLSFSGYQGCEGCKGCEVSDFIIFSISTLRGLQ